MIRGALLRIGLHAADLAAHRLPRGAAYALADLAGRAWFSLAGERRALVSANLARVSAAIGQPTSGRGLSRMVRRAFKAHARYYLEMLRLPHYSVAELGAMVGADDWDHWEPIFRNGAVVATLHLGNFEPYGTFLAVHGLTAVVPVEEIKPPELFEFLVARRATGRGADFVPVSKARRPMIEALRGGGLVALAADRDLSANGQPVSLFGHPTTLPSGPATLAVMTARPLIAAVCWRVGEERFHGRAWAVEAAVTGDRRTDVAALTDALARRFEEAITIAPEQWWAVFQPIWTVDRKSAK